MNETVTKLWSHQVETVKQMGDIGRGLNASDPGCGKSLAVLYYALENNLRTLILAPKSLVEPAWAHDLTTHLGCNDYTIAWAKNRKEAFSTQTQFTFTNTEAVNWLAPKNGPVESKILSSYDLVVLDESTSVKNPSSQRSKAARKVFDGVPQAWCMSGTPMTKTVQNIWNQIFMLDRGARLGPNISRFRWTFCTPESINGAPPGAVKWTDKPGAREQVAELIADLSIRYTLEECLTIPPNHINWLFHPLPKANQKAYKEMQQHAVTELQAGTLLKSANAAITRAKLLQICSGAVYHAESEAETLSNTRAELIADLVEYREASIVFFLWKHQRNALVKELNKRKITHGVIDGSVNTTKRNELVEHMQAGTLQTLLMHPETGAHGLTLTQAKTVIYASPPGDHPDWLTQGIARIRRGGQTEKTETIFVCTEDTIEESIYKSIVKQEDANQTFITYLKQLIGD